MRISAIVRAVAVLPSAWALGTQLSATAEFGIATGASMVAVTVAALLLAILPLFVVGLGGSPPRAPRRGPHPGMGRRLLVPAAALVLTAAVSAIGVAVQDAAGEPAQERVAAEIDGEQQSVRWTTTARTAWGASLEGTSVEAAGFPAPECVVEREGERIRVEVSSPRGAHRVVLAPDAGALHDVTIEGVEAGGSGSTSVTIVGLQAGQRAEVAFRASAAVSLLSCADETHDTAAVPGWTPPGDGISLVQPSVRVSRTVDLAAPAE